MKKLLKEEINKVKLEIKNRYLAGESVPSIAKDFDVVPRTIYFHLGKLTPEEKGMHAKNSSLKKGASAKAGKKVLPKEVSTPPQPARKEVKPDEQQNTGGSDTPDNQQQEEQPAQRPSEQGGQPAQRQENSLADFIEG